MIFGADPSPVRSFVRMQCKHRHLSIFRCLNLLELLQKCECLFFFFFFFLYKSGLNSTLYICLMQFSNVKMPLAHFKVTLYSHSNPSPKNCCIMKKKTMQTYFNLIC
ncbi:hypothetical protein HanIR_Chr09g0433341 [Helianthus annuus]|nr:hypothetical protein HanIR_Chr09g0433341 [Helianthus annuus]